jgi:hypothetical protein
MVFTGAIVTFIRGKNKRGAYCFLYSFTFEMIYLKDNMKNKPLIVKMTILVALVIISLSSCNKEVENNSIYGKYITPEKCTTCAWWETPTSRTIVEVSQSQPGYLKIVTGPGWLNEMVFDSVVLASDQSFTVNQIILDRYSISGLSYAVGTGVFTDKKIALNFMVHRRFPAPADSLVIERADKIQ